MPLYLVRWPDLCASLVRARNEEELVRRLDEVDDPGGCKWKEYRGPVWVDFNLPVTVDRREREDNRPVTVDDFDVSLGEVAQEPWRLDVIVPAADTGTAMGDSIRGFAFPALQKTIESAGLDTIDTEKLQKAVREDLRPWIEYDWRQAQLQSATIPRRTSCAY